MSARVKRKLCANVFTARDVVSNGQVRMEGSKDIGPHAFEEFKKVVREFHGYPAPGVLIGGYMVEAAKAHLPEGLLFEVVVETKKCLPDAVQLLTPCTTGNNRMRIVNLGRYALSIYDKHTGLGVRVVLDVEKVKDWPSISSWFFKLQPKTEQDSERLLEEIGAAGDSILSVTEVKIREGYFGKQPSQKTAICPFCHEAYPEGDGPICLGCRGEAPCVSTPVSGKGLIETKSTTVNKK